MILLDTNVISEMMRPKPAPVVSAWLDQNPEEDLWTALRCPGRVLSGIDLMPVGRKQSALRDPLNP